MSSSHTQSHKIGNGKTKAELAQELKDLHAKVAILTDELKRKDEELEVQREEMQAQNEELAAQKEELEDAGDNGRNCYKVSVEDNGPGIPDYMKEKILNRLQRGETKAKGLGLGLYLVKSLVESYHGRVMVEDRVPGDHRKGSRFIVYLPVAEGEHGK